MPTDRTLAEIQHEWDQLSFASRRFPCPFCGAARTKPCKTRSSRVERKRAHQQRIDKEMRRRKMPGPPVD